MDELVLAISGKLGAAGKSLSEVSIQVSDVSIKARDIAGTVDDQRFSVDAITENAARAEMMRKIWLQAIGALSISARLTRSLTSELSSLIHELADQSRSLQHGTIEFLAHMRAA